MIELKFCNCAKCGIECLGDSLRDWFYRELTLEQLLDSKGGRQSRLWARLERAETYLIERFNREDTAEEAEAFHFDLGGES